MSNRPRGRVYLVGGGPGDPGLLTVRGKQCLERAEIVLYDYLVNPRILAHAARAQQVCLGRHGRDRLLEQDEINAQLVQLAASGLVVVRLKGGDPAIFGHLAEEVAALRAAEIDYEIVPGVTAASAAASYAGIPLTQRDAASAVAFVTGQEGLGKESHLDYRRLADFPGTLVLYMGVTTVRHWTTGLMAAGKPAHTPVACIKRASWPDQETLQTTLGDLADKINQVRIRPPAVFIVGDVASLTGTLDWFSRRPLAGRTVVVTRPLGGDDPLTERLTELGANVLAQPAIEIGPPADWRPLDSAIDRLPQFDWLVFASANGVTAFVERLLAGPRDLRALASLRLAAVGPGTAEALARYHLRADLIPSEYCAEGLAEALVAELARGAGRRFLLVRASRGREVLAEQLRAADAVVEEVVAYTSRDVTLPDAGVAERLAAGQVDWITVTSSAIARSLAGLLGGASTRAKLASISPITSAALRSQGLEPAAEADQSTLNGLVAAILAWHAVHEPPVA
jgi:uroporphyrinogen III methyltransferase / synthase